MAWSLGDSVNVPLIVIVGETASGKSALAMELAKKFNGEIIAADSRTIYQGMDIGTAKPTLKEQSEVPHYFLDIIEPNQTYSAAQYKQDAMKLIEDINKRGKLPIMVGGSGLYIDSVIFNYEFRKADLAKRSQLDRLSIDDLQENARTLGISETSVDYQNRRHLQRAVEAGGVLKKKQHLRPNTLVIGLKLEKKVLEHRINDRVNSMIENGLVEEVKHLGEKYGWDNEAMNGIGYRFIGQYIGGEITLEEAKKLLVRGDMNLAKRQRTWFKRNKYIQWIDDPKSAFTLVQTFLSHVE